jgi:GDP-D-mannose dehydratase
VLGWQPRVNFADLIEMMIDSDIELLSKNTTKAAIV